MLSITGETEYRVYGNSVLYSQFFCKINLFLKIKVYLKLEGKKKHTSISSMSPGTGGFSFTSPALKWASFQ